MDNKNYKSINLPSPLVEELKLWKIAFSAAYGKDMSYADMLRSVLDSLEDSEPAVVEEMDRLLEKHPDLAEKLGR